MSEAHCFLPLVLSLRLPARQSQGNRHGALQHRQAEAELGNACALPLLMKAACRILSIPVGKPPPEHRSTLCCPWEVLESLSWCPYPLSALRLPCVVFVYLNHVSLKFACLQQKSLQSLSRSMHVQSVQRGLWKLVYHMSRGRFPCSFSLSVAASQRRREPV